MTTNNEHTCTSVPARPTAEMVRAGAAAAREYYERTGGNDPAVIYRAMIAAAPALAAAPGARHATPQGWRLVPDQPSIAMCIHGAAVTDGAINGHAAGQVYAMMLLMAERPDVQAVPDAQQCEHSEHVRPADGVCVECGDVVQDAQPFMYGIATPDGKPYFDELCVSGERGDLRDEVDSINVNQPADAQYTEVALYTRPAPLQDVAPTDAQPMAGEQPDTRYRLLDEGDTIQADDEFVGDDGTSWLHPSDLFVGMRYVNWLKTGRRRIDACTQQDGGAA